jgi:hypothetical protein
LVKNVECTWGRWSKADWNAYSQAICATAQVLRGLSCYREVEKL